MKWHGLREELVFCLLLLPPPRLAGEGWGGGVFCSWYVGSSLALRALASSPSLWEGAGGRVPSSPSHAPREGVGGRVSLLLTLPFPNNLELMERKNVA